MKVARLYDYLDIRIEDEAIPEVGPREALVRMRACGICSGDVVAWYIRKKAPLVFGHEPAGEIAALGAEVEGWSVGQRVFVHHHAPCLQCRACRQREYVQCPVWKQTNLRPGGMAEYFVVPEVNLANDTLALPASVSFEDAALVEPTACVVKSLRRAGDVRGATVLVIGLGVMGQLHVLLARAAGAARVLAADLVADRCRHAAGLGADQVIDASKVDLVDAVNAATEGQGAEIVIAGPATVQALETGLRCVARGGTVVQFMGTPPGQTLSLDTFDYYFREVRLIPSYSCGPPDTREALRLIEQGTVRAGHVVTHRFALDDAARAYEHAATNTSAIKTLVTA
jgi:L-iditol 2-dehydrogenase